MTVYVDDFRVPATVGGVGGVWSHMLVPPEQDLDELHVMAALVGLRRSHFQNKGWPQAHYDATEPVRARAVEAGAVEVSARAAARWRADAIAAEVAVGAARPSGLPWPPGRRLPALTVHQPWALASLGVGVPLPDVAAPACALGRVAVLWGCSHVIFRCLTEGQVPGCLA